MKHLDDKYKEEVKDHRYKINPTENFILIERKPLNFLRTEYQVRNETKHRNSQKVVQNRGRLEVKPYPKQNINPVIGKLKIFLRNCPSFKEKICLK